MSPPEDSAGPSRDRASMRLALPALGVLLVAAVWFHGTTERPGSPAARRVVVLGLDGMDPDFLEYLLSQGKLPSFQRLRREGAYAPLRTFKPTKSVVLWTSVATGKRMEKHGIVDWQLLSPEGRKVLASGHSRTAEALWNIATRARRTVQVLNWWATWPAEDVRGEIVSNHFPRSRHEPLDDATFPPSLAAELEELGLPEREDANQALAEAGMPVYSRDLAASAFRPSTNFEARFRTAAGVFNDDMITERALRHLFGTRGQADLVMVLFRTADVYTHFMWRFIDRRVAAPAYRALREEGQPVTREMARRMKEAYARVLEPVYVHEDRRLGRILDAIGPDTVLIVLSDHGFQFRNYGFNHYDDGRGDVLAPDGVLFVWGESVKPGARLDRPELFDVAPTALYLLGIPSGRDMDGRVLTEAFSPRLLESRPLQWVDTHETGGRPGGSLESPVDEEVLEELRSLGYVP